MKSKLEQKVDKGFRLIFLKYLTEDSETNDARRKDFNQAIFDKDEGWAVWSETTLNMVMNAYDAAVKEYEVKS